MSDATLEHLSQCNGKFPYESFGEAQKIVKRIRSRRSRHDNPQRVYRCEHCRKWHVASQYFSRGNT